MVCEICLLNDFRKNKKYVNMYFSKKKSVFKQRFYAYFCRQFYNFLPVSGLKMILLINLLF